MILANGINTSLVAYYLDFINGMITTQIQTQLLASVCPFPYFSCFPVNTNVCLQLISRMSLWPSLTILSCLSIFHSPISLPGLKSESIANTTLSLWFFFNGFLKMSTGPGAARDQHFCASMMALLHSYVPPHSLKYMCVIRPSVSLPSGYQLKVFISSSLPLKNLAQIHHLLFHSCYWHQFRQRYNCVTRCHLSSGFGPLTKSASISN